MFRLTFVNTFEAEQIVSAPIPFSNLDYILLNMKNILRRLFFNIFVLSANIFCKQT
jgi:hypothetical protein